LVENSRVRTNSEQAHQYRRKAERLRALAVDLPGEARAALLEVADGYDKMAATVARAALAHAARSAPRANRLKKT
jgi:hypothetical protein